MAPVTDIPAIHGTCAARFAGVRGAMTENFRQHGEVGAAVAVTISGTPVVDLWAGWLDRSRTRPWQRDTLVDVFSVGKAMAALSLLVLADRGQVDVDAPVTRYWPEFAARGKDAITVRMLLGHRAGLPAIRHPLPDLAMYDWELMATALADEAPWWEPGTLHGYHVNTFGFLVGEIVRRVSGRSIHAFFRDEIAVPLDADFHFGIGAQHDHRIAEYYFAESPPRIVADADDAARRFLLGCVYTNPPGIIGLGTVNTREWRAAVMPSTNGHATARAVARIYSALACDGTVDGIRVLQPTTIEQAITEVSCGPDLVLGRPSRFGLGFQLTQPERRLGPNPRSFGHFGAGGALGFADPDARLAFAYTMNQAGPRFQSPCTMGLIEAVYASL
jgi:CubicO group peptidase (beta-lactamase class C family)